MMSPLLALKLLNVLKLEGNWTSLLEVAVPVPLAEPLAEPLADPLAEPLAVKNFITIKKL